MKKNRWMGTRFANCIFCALVATVYTQVEHEWHPVDAQTYHVCRSALSGSPIDMYLLRRY
jgi:hypothetical protein